MTDAERIRSDWRRLRERERRAKRERRRERLRRAGWLLYDVAAHVVSAIFRGSR